MRRVQAKALVVVVVSAFFCIASFAADPTVGDGSSAKGSLPAVDGVNGKLSGFGGSRAGQAIYGGDAAITVPLGTRFGFQLDGLAAGFDSQSQTSLAVIGTGAHLFWRDPAVGLLGAYGNYVHSNAFGSSNSGSAAGEGALYLDRIRLDALVGVQGGTGTPAWFFGVAQLSYYPIDNLRGWVGQSYVFGRTALSLGAEYGFATGSGTMPALFATGTRLDDGTSAFVVGMRLYLGQRDKPLIRRQREDDPPNWLGGAAGAGMQGNPGSPPVCQCSQTGCFTKNGAPCVCDGPSNAGFSCLANAR